MASVQVWFHKFLIENAKQITNFMRSSLSVTNLAPFAAKNKFNAFDCRSMNIFSGEVHASKFTKEQRIVSRHP